MSCGSRVVIQTQNKQGEKRIETQKYPADNVPIQPDLKTNNDVLNATKNEKIVQCSSRPSVNLRSLLSMIVDITSYNSNRAYAEGSRISAGVSTLPRLGYSHGQFAQWGRQVGAGC